MWSVWALARRVRLDSEETLPALIDERGEMICTVPGATPDGGPVEGGANSGTDRTFGSGKAPRLVVCKTGCLCWNS